MPREKMLIVTNLYPLPWEPGRASFNRQQFALLESEYDLSFLVPVQFIDWFKHLKQVSQSDRIRYVPYFFTPKIGRRFYSVFMFLSLLLHSGLWLKKRSPDVMLASWAYPDAVATSWLAALFRTRFYFKVHGSDVHMHGLIPARAKQIVSAANSAEKIISVSDELKKQLTELGISQAKVQVIYNGVDHQLFAAVAKREIEDPYILFVGNLKQDKGVMELLQAFNRLRQAGAIHKLVIAGNGPMRASIGQYCAEHAIEEHVTLLGNVAHSKLPALMQHAKLLVLPSYHEGVPNVLLESMAAGTPVVATAVGGIPEIVSQGVTGLLVPTPEPVALAAALDAALVKDWDRSAIQQHASQFTWQKNKEQMLQAFEKISTAS